LPATKTGNWKMQIGGEIAQPILQFPISMFQFLVFVFSNRQSAIANRQSDNPVDALII